MKMIFLGIQGSGKSTQAKLLSEKLNLPYVEMGQLLRDRLSEQSEEASQIRQALEVGDLVPNEITINTLEAKIRKDQFKNGFILDGYPRNEIQLKALPGKFDKVFYIELSKGEAIKRLTQRGRKDDTPQVIKRRVELFFKETQPIVDSFKKEGVLQEIDGQPSIEEVTQLITNKLENKI